MIKRYKITAFRHGKVFATSPSNPFGIRKMQNTNSIIEFLSQIETNQVRPLAPTQHEITENIFWDNLPDLALDFKKQLDG